jgi:hypothetical protein
MTTSVRPGAGLENTFRRGYLNCNLGYIVKGVVLVLRETEMGTSRICRNLRVSRRTRIPVPIAVVVAVVSMVVGACSRAPLAHSSPLPLQPVGEVALPGDGSRFDYASLDSGRGLLFIAHLGASEVVEVDVHAHAVVRTIPNLAQVHGVFVVPELRRVLPPPPATIRWSSWTRTPARL